jgi:hypothetical protein
MSVSCVCIYIYIVYLYSIPWVWNSYSIPEGATVGLMRARFPHAPTVFFFLFPSPHLLPPVPPWISNFLPPSLPPPSLTTLRPQPSPCHRRRSLLAARSWDPGVDPAPSRAPVPFSGSSLPWFLSVASRPLLSPLSSSGTFRLLLAFDPDRPRHSHPFPTAAPPAPDRCRSSFSSSIQLLAVVPARRRRSSTSATAVDSAPCRVTLRGT